MFVVRFIYLIIRDMKITIEWTAEELKWFWIYHSLLWQPFCAPHIIEEVKKGEDNTDWITTEWDWITFRYKWKERSLYKYNEKKSDWNEYFTFDEAVEYCEKLNDRHLPSIEERQELLKARCEWTGYKMFWKSVYGSDSEKADLWVEFSEDFKLPFAGYRDYNGTSIDDKGTNGLYWSSSPRPSNANNSYYLRFSSSYVSPQSSGYRSNGFSVRCFKNSSTRP